jgi:hypothetical protein
MNQTLIVELETGIYLAGWEWQGKPGRTVDREQAWKFTSNQAALKALDAARRSSGRAFVRATVVPLVQEVSA